MIYTAARPSALICVGIHTAATKSKLASVNNRRCVINSRVCPHFASDKLRHTSFCSRIGGKATPAASRRCLQLTVDSAACFCLTGPASSWISGAKFSAMTQQTCAAAHDAASPRWGSDCSGEAAAGIDRQAAADSVVMCVAVRGRATGKPLSMAAARSSSRAMLAAGCLGCSSRAA